MDLIMNLHSNDIDVYRSPTNGVTLASTDIGKKNVLQKCQYTDIYDERCEGDFVELSIYGGKVAQREEIVAECAILTTVFPIEDKDTSKKFYSVLYDTIEREGMSAERLKAAVHNLVTTHVYPTFSIANIVGFDKTLKVASSVSALRYLAKSPKLAYTEIVVICGYLDKNERKMFGIKAEIECSAYRNRIIGVWNEDLKGWDVLRQIKDNTIPQRQAEFKQSLYVYCNYPPKYNGKYSPSDINEFYKYYSQVVEFGDKLRFETFMKWDAEMFLQKWFKNRHSDTPPKPPKPPTPEKEKDEVSEQEALKNKIALSVISENMSLYRKLSPKEADAKIAELINARLKENGIQTN